MHNLALFTRNFLGTRDLTVVDADKDKKKQHEDKNWAH